MDEAAFDGAEPHADIVPRTRLLRCGPGIPVSQRVDDDIGIVLLDVLCDGVDKAQQGPRRAPLLLVSLTAGRALAVAQPVVLRYGDDAGQGVLADPFPDRLFRDLQHRRIRQAER